MFDITTPLLWRNFMSVGICSRSDGTFGLSRKKCTLSNVMLMTCWTPLPKWHDEDVAAGFAAGASTAAVTGTAAAVIRAPVAARRPMVVAARRVISAHAPSSEAQLRVVPLLPRNLNGP